MPHDREPRSGSAGEASGSYGLPGGWRNPVHAFHGWRGETSLSFFRFFSIFDFVEGSFWSPVTSSGTNAATHSHQFATLHELYLIMKARSWNSFSCVFNFRMSGLTLEKVRTLPRNLGGHLAQDRQEGIRLN